MVEHNNKNGFTLLEVLVSFTLLSIVILVFFSAFQRYAQVSNINDDNLVAMNLAKKVTVGMDKNTNEILEKYGNFYNENAFLDLNNEIENNFLNVEILEQLEINNIPYYKVMSGDQVFFISIKNITADNNKVKEHATINVEVLDSRLTKVVAENFGYISTVASANEDNTEDINQLATELAQDVIDTMVANQTKINSKYYANNNNTSLYFNVTDNQHVSNNDQSSFFFKQDISTPCPNNDTCYKVNRSNDENTFSYDYIFTIKNIDPKGTDNCTIEVQIYNSNFEELTDQSTDLDRNGGN